ncbi:unnamed protein product [Rotaria magnacalcarata]|uniref:Uncharacterized protein n=1 Tax=Rotaria magnacalcarata TaxID=392030 RepID=A0A815S5Y0_9BILA|nr:unnamed protein product [Rotaria magnacalcarata]
MENRSSHIPTGFIETVPPRPGSKEWYSLNSCSNVFVVESANDHLNVSKVKNACENKLKISSGTLFGLDQGEWGGQLVFIPDDTTKKSIVIKNGNMKFSFIFKDKIYFIEGLAHMSVSKGALYELDITNNNFDYKKIIDFEDSPEAFTICHNKLFIASHRCFYVLENFEKKILFKDTFWDSLYPSSIAVIDEQNVFVGIRGGIAKLDLTKQSLEFYKNTN